MTRIRTDSKRAARGLVKYCLVASLCAVAVTVVSDAWADQAEQRALARGHFNRGVELAKAGSYEAALAEFEQAYQLSPHFSVLYNIGQAELALERPRLAVEALRRYLAEGGEQIEPARRAEVLSTIATELERLGPHDAVHDAPRAAAPSEATPAAQAAVTASPLAVTPSTTSEPPRLAPVAPLEPSAEPAGDAKRPLAYVLGATGVALAAAAAAHYAWNQGRYEDWQESYADYYLDPRPARRSAANALAESVERASRVTVALAIGAGVTLGAGTVLFFGSSAPSKGRAGGSDRWIGVRGTF
jgi:tetratricopeptide (TPR) repeat protein